MSAEPQVSVLIPAYRSADFIGRTLLFARGQSYKDIRIVVSVDSDCDTTGQIARHHAQLDERVVVYQQPVRLGWAGNVNFLLEQVNTPLFSIYFHDDILLPKYTEKLRRKLQQHPEASGVYCAMGHFGATEYVSSGVVYSGDAVHRLITLMLHPQRGSPLRAMLRSEQAGHVRLPDMGSGGFWANEPFLMDVLLSGPMQYVPEVLYRRWDQRAGGLTDGWNSLSNEKILAAWATNIDVRLGIIERASDDPAALAALRFALFARCCMPIMAFYEERGPAQLPPVESIHPLFANPGTPELLNGYGNVIESSARNRYAQFRQWQANAW